MPDLRVLRPGGPAEPAEIRPWDLWQPIGRGYTCTVCGTTTADEYFLQLNGGPGAGPAATVPVRGTPWTMGQSRTTWQRAVHCAACHAPPPPAPPPPPRKRTLD